MSNRRFFQQQLKAGRFSYEELPDLQASDFTASFLESPGVVHHGREYLSYSDIFYGEGDEDNAGRAESSSSGNIKDLAESRKQGIIPSSTRPVVERNNIVDLSGKTYSFKAGDGFTRYKADQYNGEVDGGDWFDIVTFEDTYDEDGELIHTAAYNKQMYLQKLNDAPPRQVHTVKDLVHACCTLIKEQSLPRIQEHISTFVYESAPNLSTAKKNEVIRQVLKAENVPTKTRSWRDNECWAWYDKHCTDKDDVKIDYFFPDHYFQDRIYPVLKQFYQTETVQNIAEHVNNSGDNPDVVQTRRQNADGQWEEARKVFQKVAQFGMNQMLSTGKFELPVKRENYMPQIQSGEDKENQNKFVRH